MSTHVYPGSTPSLAFASTPTAPSPATIASPPATNATHPPCSIVLEHPQVLSAEYHDRHSVAMNIYLQTFTDLMGEFFATPALAQKWVLLNQLKQNLEWAKDDLELLKKRRDIETRMFNVAKLRLKGVFELQKWERPIDWFADTHAGHYDTLVEMQYRAAAQGGPMSLTKAAVDMIPFKNAISVAPKTDSEVAFELTDDEAAQHRAQAALVAYRMEPCREPFMGSPAESPKPSQSFEESPYKSKLRKIAPKGAADGERATKRARI